MTSSPPVASAAAVRGMKGIRQTSESGREARTHANASAQSRYSAAFDHEADLLPTASVTTATAASHLFHLGPDADHLCADEELLERYEEDDCLADDDMTADSAMHVHRRTASPADCASARKSNKPLMEKKRRQRINRCLNDLKTLVLEALKKDPSRYSKLEKADILEMTVRHVQALHRQESACVRGRLVGGDEMSKYRAGFAQCATEVSRYLSNMEGLPHDLHANVLSHLNAIASSVTSNVNTNATCVQNSVNVAPNPPPIIFVLNTAPSGGCAQPSVAQVHAQPIAFQDNSGNSLGAQPHVTLVTTAKPPLQQLPQLQPQLQSQLQPQLQPQIQTQQGGLQILPTRLSNGDLALVLPATLPAAPQQNIDDRRQPSAALQASSPVLTAILTSNRSHSSSSSSTSSSSSSSVVVAPPALSTSSEDSALGAEVHDTSDSDISSGISTPLSSVSSAGSPLPMEEGGRSSPKRGAPRASPTLKPHVFNSSHFREELGQPSCPQRSAPRRQPLLAPKPTYAPHPQPKAEAPRARKEGSPPREPPPQQGMWRPWH